MDKPSERKADSKKFGDTDAGTERNFGKCNVRAELEGLWDHAPEAVVGQGLGQAFDERLLQGGQRQGVHRRYD